MSETSAHQFETRTCACGCGLTFRCWVESPQKFAGRMCEADVTPGGLESLHRRDAISMAKRKRGKKPMPNGMLGTDALAEALGVSAWSVRAWARACV